MPAFGRPNLHFSPTIGRPRRTVGCSNAGEQLLKQQVKLLQESRQAGLTRLDSIHLYKQCSRWRAAHRPKHTAFNELLSHIKVTGFSGCVSAFLSSASFCISFVAKWSFGEGAEERWDCLAHGCWSAHGSDIVSKLENHFTLVVGFYVGS